MENRMVRNACGKRRKTECRGSCVYVYGRCRSNQPPCAQRGTNTSDPEDRRQLDCESNALCEWKRWNGRPQHPLRCYAQKRPAACPHMDQTMERSYWSLVKRIQRPLAGSVYVAPSPGKGLGLYAARPLRPGERITTYHGVLVPDNVLQGWSVSQARLNRSIWHSAPNQPRAYLVTPFKLLWMAKSWPCCLHIDGVRGTPPPKDREVGLGSYANDGRGIHPVPPGVHCWTDTASWGGIMPKL